MAGSVSAPLISTRARSTAAYETLTGSSRSLALNIPTRNSPVSRPAFFPTVVRKCRPISSCTKAGVAGYFKQPSPGVLDTAESVALAQRLNEQVLHHVIHILRGTSCGGHLATGACGGATRTATRQRFAPCGVRQFMAEFLRYPRLR